MAAWQQKGFLILAGVLLAGGLAAVLVFHGGAKPERRLERGLHVGSLPVECPDLKLGIRDLRVVSQGSFTGWEYHLICAQPEGCNARIQLVFHFLAGGRPGEAAVSRSIRLARGQTLHDGFLQRPAVVVGRVTGVEARRLTPAGGTTEATPLPW